ncbi:10872_t:CDS:2 [Paraglomus occultum]|uniref:10872_t:CDS:1 n=1 Tax=Paraglomus occultum TaxID=144539 RepID=A0A9N9FGS9_9GLOM|nr:10872_t:CDS:2 [Paraglomus occultum]
MKVIQLLVIYQDSVIPISPTKTILISLDEKEENEFPDKKHRETVSKETIQKIKEKKLRDQETIITSQNTVPIISREQGFIQEISAGQRKSSCDAEKQAIKANQDEILCWYHYVIEFDNNNQVKDIMKMSRLIQTILDHFTKKPDIEYTDEQDNSSDDQDLELPEASINASTGTEVSEVSDTNANDNKPQSLITALSDDEPENFSDEFTNDNEEDGSFCTFSDDDDEGYYYDLNTSETYTKSNRSIYAY